VVVADISDGATLTLSDAADNDPGEHQLTVEVYDTPYVVVGVRILVDPHDPADLAAVHTLQDQLALAAGSSEPFVMPDYDEASFDSTRQALLELGRGIGGFDRAFGARDEVDPVRHLIGTAAGWGGLPETEAFYVNVEPGLPVGDYELTVGDVPVDAFWSISVYNADGFFEPNERNVNNLNSVTAVPNGDGSITVHLGGCGEDRPNCIPIMNGWNYLIRLYRPRPPILDGSWTFPTISSTEPTPSVAARM
jgi:hypothetical protein